MTRKNSVAHATVLGLMLGVLPGFGANWSACNDKPVRVKYPPMNISWDLCSMPEESAQFRAFSSALRETRNYVGALGFGAGFKRIINGRCVIEHDNNRSDVAMVNRADIDGKLGLTITELDGCTWSWSEEFIVTADVMTAADLGYTRINEAAVFRSYPNGSNIGALVVLHELGHALGLDHSSEFAVLRDGPTRVPLVGMSPGSGGLGNELMPDDVYGISRIYGFTPSYRNVFVSSQMMYLGALEDNNRNSTLVGTQHPDPLQVCAGNKISFYATVGNNSTTRESFRATAYIDKDPNVYVFPAGPVWNISMGQGIYTFPIYFMVPTDLPVGVPYYAYVAISSELWDRKGYDNAARSRLRIVRKAGC